MALRTVGVRLTAEIAEYQSKLKQAGQSTRDFKGEMDRAAKGGHLDAVARQAAGAGLALTGMAAYAIKSAADFDKAMSAVAAATHAPSDQIAQLRAAAIQAGKDTQYSATEAAQGITELSKAGVSTADVLGGGLKGALSLAAAGQLSVAEAAETSASALTQFKLSGSQVPHVADLLAAAAGKAQGSVHDVGQALNQSGLVAAQFGLSIEDTTGTLAEFANAGLTGSDAGTSFKTMLLAMAKTSEQTRDLMNDLGISFYDAQGKFIGMSGVAQVLQTRLKGLTDAQRQQALGQIFGNDAIRAASILYADGAAGVQKWKGAVDDAGYASSTAAKLTDNLAGDLERLKGSLETMAIEAGGGANSGLRVLVKVAGALVDQFGKLPPAIGGSVTVIAGAVGAASLLAAGWIKARKSGAEFRAELEAMGPAGAKTAAGLSRVGSAVGKIGLAFAALEVAGAVIGHFQKDLNPQVEALGVGLQRFAADGKTAGETSRLLGDNLKDLKVGFRFLADDSGRSKAVKNLQQSLESIVPGLAGTNTSLAKTQERIKAVDDSLSQMVSAGNADQARAIFDALGRQLAVDGVSMDEFRSQFPAYAAALEASGSATKGTTSKLGDLNSALDTGAAAQNKYKTHADAAAGAARGERAALGALFSELKAQTDPVFALIDAQHKLTDAQDAAAKAVKAHGRNSKEARAAQLDLAKAAIELQGATGNLSASFDGKLTPAFRDTLRAAGLTDRQIKSVEGQFKDAKVAADKYTGKYEANVSAPGAKQAKKETDLAYTSANGYAGPYVAKLSVHGYASVRSNLLDLMTAQYKLEHPNASSNQVAEDRREKGRFLAAGGPVYGPGTSTSDSIPARLSAGEHVWTAAEVATLGGQQAMLSLRAAVRSGKQIEVDGGAPGYAQGGAAMPYPVDVRDTKIPSWSDILSKWGGEFGRWPSSPSAQRGDSGVWRKILALVKASGIRYEFGNAYRPGDPLWHGSGRAIDFMGYNQDRLAQFFLARQGQVLELIHRTKNRDYGITRGHYNAMPHQWPLHRNHLHIAMKDGGQITEPIYGVGASGRTYSFGENWQPETVTPNWRSGSSVAGVGAGGQVTNVNVTVAAPIGSSPREIGKAVADVLDSYCRGGGRIQLRGTVSA
jgi:TP901 family phage tail tape measure protein